jgi:hypothetical protein
MNTQLNITAILEAVSEAETTVAAAAERAKAVPELQAEADRLQAEIGRIEASAATAIAEAEQEVGGNSQIAQLRDAVARAQGLPASVKAQVLPQVMAALAEVEEQAATRVEQVRSARQEKLKPLRDRLVDVEEELTELQADPYVRAWLEQQEEERRAELARQEERRREVAGLRTRLGERLEQVRVAMRAGYALRSDQECKSACAMVQAVRDEARSAGQDDIVGECRRLLGELRDGRREWIKRQGEAERREQFREFARWCDERTAEPYCLVVKIAPHYQMQAVALNVTPLPSGGVEFRVGGCYGAEGYPIGTVIRQRDLPRQAMAWHVNSGQFPWQPCVGQLRFWRGYQDGSVEYDPVSSLAEAVALLRQAEPRQVACGLEDKVGDQWMEWETGGLNLAQSAVLFRAKSADKGSGGSWAAIWRGVHAAEKLVAAQRAFAAGAYPRLAESVPEVAPESREVPEADAEITTAEPGRPSSQQAGQDLPQPAETPITLLHAPVALEAPVRFGDNGAQRDGSQSETPDELAALELPASSAEALREAGLTTLDAVSDAVRDLDVLEARIGGEASAAILDVLTAPAQQVEGEVITRDIVEPVIGVSGAAIPVQERVAWQGAAKIGLAATAQRLGLRVLEMVVDGDGVTVSADDERQTRVFQVAVPIGASRFEAVRAVLAALREQVPVAA